MSNDAIENDGRTDAPPTRAGDVPEQRTAWPIVIGIIALVVGGFGVLANGCGGLVGNVAIVFFFDRSEAQGGLDPVTGAQMGVLRGFVVINAVAAVVGSVLGVLLLIGGIGLTRRRPWSRTVLVVWSITRAVYAVPAVIAGYFMSAAQFEAMEEAAESSGSAMPMGLFTLMRGVGLAGAVFALLWAWALPAFLVVWLSRDCIKKEVALWATSRGSGFGVQGSGADKESSGARVE